MKIPRIKYDFSKITKKPLATVLVLVLVVSSVISLTLLQKPSSAKAAWYTTGGTWQYRQMITIDHSKVPNTDQADFPVLIKITDPTNPVFAQALSSGYDIMFTAADTTTPRSYEIEKFDPTNHELDVWVKIPTLSHTVDTAIYMYYGNSAATAPVTSIAQAVWSNGYAGVWHQNESSGTFYDSSSCLKNGSISGSVGYSASGKIGKAADLTGGYIDIADSDTLSPTGTGLLSLGAWIKPDTLIGSNTVLSKYTAGNVPNSEYLLFVRSDGIGFYLDGTNPSNYEVGGVVPYAFQTGLWYHIDAIYNGNTMGIYVNGNFIGNAATPGSKILSNSPVSAKIGGGYSSNFAGIIDEPKISNTTRSADWIATEYANQSSPSTFISLGGQTFYDGIAPSNPTVISAYSDSGLSSPLVSGNFYNYATPYFVWPAAQAAGGAHDTGDNGIVSGVAGYYSYFGTSCGSGGGNPAQSPGILSDTGGGLHFSTSPNITIPSLGTNEGTYCLRIKASDNAGNINSTTWEAYSAYKYDSSVPNVPSFIAVNPAGYSSVDSFDFSWPAASDVINASASGLAGYQYERGGTSGDSWSATITDLQIKGIKGLCIIKPRIHWIHGKVISIQQS